MGGGLGGFQWNANEGDFSLKEDITKNNWSQGELEKWPSGKEPETQEPSPGWI